METSAPKYRLDIFLSEKIAELSRSQIQKSIKSKLVTINDKIITAPHHFLKLNDIIKITLAAEIKTDPAKPNEILSQIKIVKQTDDYLIIEKPAGLLTHPTENQPEAISLITWLTKEFPQTAHLGENPLRPALVHRLDKEVSGLMLIPLTQTAFDYFKTEFKLHHVAKEYTGLVYGRFEKKEGIINLPISRSKTTGRMATHSQKQGGKNATTLYEVIEEFTNYSLLKIKIETGRTNQIRVHFNALGHSLIGDPLYKSKNITKPIRLGRVFLHASYLKFALSSGEEVSYSSELPVQLKNLLTDLK